MISTILFMNFKEHLLGFFLNSATFGHRLTPEPIFMLKNKNKININLSSEIKSMDVRVSGNKLHYPLNVILAAIIIASYISQEITNFV